MSLKKQNRQLNSYLLFVVIIMFLATNAVTDFSYYKNYKYNIDLVAETVYESDADGIDRAISFLKNEQLEHAKAGRAVLKEYGYLAQNENVFFKRFQKECIYTAMITFLLAVLFYVLLFFWHRRVTRREQEFMQNVDATITGFREGGYEVFLEPGSTEESGQVRYQLDALGNYLQLLKEEARLEKEGTKELVADISHQLKTPVAALDACFSVLLSGNLSADEQQEFKVRCRTALDGLETLLQSLLEISKMEAGLIQIEKQKLPLLDTIVMAVNRVYPSAAEKSIELVCDYDESIEDYAIRQDKRWLSEAIINVLDNAVKYSEPDSEVRIGVQKRPGFLRMEISDQGIGIPKEEYHKIFQRFYRGSMPKVKAANGSGIGLFLAREIIEKHQGTITVSSNVQRKQENHEVSKQHGSTFVIQLPDEE